MRMRNLAIAIGSLGLVVTPIVAQAEIAPAARAGSPVDDAEGIAGGGAFIIGLLALAAVVGGVIIATEDEETPTSP